MGYRCIKNSENCLKEKEMVLLLGVTTILGESKVDLNKILSLLAESLDVYRLFLTIFNRESKNILIEGSFGVDQNETKDIVYHLGEGIIGKVVEKGEVNTIYNVAESKEFLNRTNAPINSSNGYTTFICIPVKYKNEVVGTLSLHKLNKELDVEYNNEIRLLKIIAGMVGLSLRRRQEHSEEIVKLKNENNKLRGDLYSHNIQPAEIKGKSSKMSEVFALINSVAQTDATVLVRGESGVGKELVAKAIHNQSKRKNKPFIAVNCAALPDSLIESELFGHEKGAFTGANSRNIGKFEAADGGTIFLDEFGDVPAPTQIKLLRALQEREIQRIGSNETIKINVRILCATNRDLEQMIKDGCFREDLYYRINVFPIFIPPLRERINDIPVLIDHFIDKFNCRYDKKIRRITSMAIETLMMYSWPGNIRELENCIERACILSEENVIRTHNLPHTLQTALTSETTASGTLESIMRNVEKQIIIDALVTSKGNSAKAAAALGVTERIMGLRINKYSIETKRYKEKL